MLSNTPSPCQLIVLCRIAYLLKAQLWTSTWRFKSKLAISSQSPSIPSPSATDPFLVQNHSHSLVNPKQAKPKLHPTLSHRQKRMLDSLYFASPIWTRKVTPPLSLSFFVLLLQFSWHPERLAAKLFSLSLVVPKTQQTIPWHSIFH